MDIPDRLQQFGGGRPLQNIPCRPCDQRLENVLIVLENGQHHDLQVLILLLEFFHAFNARHLWEVDIHEHDIGDVRRQISKRLFSTPACRRAQKSFGTVDQHRQALADFIIVFDDRYFDWHRVKIEVCLFAVNT